MWCSTRSCSGRNIEAHKALGTERTGREIQSHVDTRRRQDGAIIETLMRSANSNQQKVKELSTDTRTNENRSYLEQRLFETIATILLVHLDVEHKQLPTETRDKVAEDCIHMSKEVAGKIVEGLKATYGRLDPTRWQEIVDQSLHDQAIKVEGKPLAPSEVAFLREAIKTMTARCVAPPGSAWERAIENGFTQRTDSFLKVLGATAEEAKKEIERAREVMDEVREIATREIERLQGCNRSL